MILVFLFFTQSAGRLIESIYILDLMNTTLDEKALGVLFFLLPCLFLPFYKKYPDLLAWLAYAMLFFGHSLLPYLKTGNRVIASGLAVFGILTFSFLLFKRESQKGTFQSNWVMGRCWSDLGVGFSEFLRTRGYGLDLSLTHAGGWCGWALSL